MELKIKNFGHGSGVEVRIIKVSADAVFENLNNQFQQMDDVGMEHGVNIAASMVISCDGASPIVGSVHLGPAEGDARVGVYVEDKLIGTVDSNVGFDDLFDDLDDPNINISAHYLQEWYPPIISDNGVN